MIRFFRNLLFDDFWLKLVSLALAILVYLVVFFLMKKEALPAVGRSREKIFSGVPVEVVSSSGDVSRFTVQPSVVDLTVQGSIKIVNPLKLEDIHVFVDLSSWDGRSATAQAVQVATPAGVALVSVSSPEVEVRPPPAEP